jgi:hypothetical protein
MDSELELFASAVDVAKRAEAFSSLIKLKKHHRAAKEPEFITGVQGLLAAASSPSADATGRLLAVATLLRIAALIKPWTDRIVKGITSALAEPLPPLEVMADPDDRYYIATCWRVVARPWIKTYLAAGAVREDGSERVRLECMEGVLCLSVDLEAALIELVDPLRRLHFDTEQPGDSKMKRLRRVLAAMNLVFSTTPKEPGASAGACIRRVLIESMQNVPAAVDRKVIGEVAEETLKLIHGIVRARFSCVTDEETYAAMDVVREWSRGYDWEDFAEESPSSRLIARDLKGALELLIRAGVSDDKLYSRLVLATGNESRARCATREILERNPGLPDELSRWLAGEPVRRKSAFAAQTEAAQYDEFVADLLLDCSRLRSMEDTFNREGLPEINVRAPGAAIEVSRILGVVRSFRNAVETAAAIRLLSLRGRVGEIVDFSPLEHELAGGPQPGIRTVRVVRLAVEAPGGSAGRRIVRKAIVEPAE